jgi:hypothetical protein
MVLNILSRDLLEKLSQSAGHEIHYFHEIRKFISIFTIAHHWTLVR